jgi:prepilin-type processing-associated H-X9-DG protein/prepilin-type N-terminal cleavage/methylation domain-containing protein
MPVSFSLARRLRRVELPRRERRANGAFSLVELLVVLAIIALLLALLLPAIPAVRARAAEVACQARLRDLGHAALMHANAHDGYLPAAGWQWNPTGGTVNPQGMDDQARRKYLYYEDGGEKRPAPITVALAIAGGADIRLDSRESLEEDMDKPAFRRLFQCPAHPDPREGFTQIASDGWQSPNELCSYIFNEALLGRRNRKTPRQVVGNLAGVARPSEVFFAMDGQPRDRRNDRLLLVYDIGPADTLYDFSILQLTSGNVGSDALDFNRHRFRANVLFLDWHVESVLLDRGGMSGVGISKGIYNVALDDGASASGGTP